MNLVDNTLPTHSDVHNTSHSKPQYSCLPSSVTRVLRSDTIRLASAPRVTKPYCYRRRRPPHLDPWYPKRKRNPNPQPPRRCVQPSHFTCRICIEYQPLDQFVSWVPPKRNSHYPPPEVPYQCVSHLAPNPSQRKIDPICKTCIGAFMAARLDMYGARKVTVGCVEPGCNAGWNVDHVLQYMTPGEPLEKYNMAMMDQWKIDAKDNLVTCLSDSCNAIGIADADSPGYPQVACPDCELRMCAACRVPWHTDLTCAEYGMRHINEMMTDEEMETLKMLQEKDGKRCPNCHIVIEKDGGCNSMHCSGCNKYFDWATAASVVPGSKKVAEPVYYPGWGLVGPSVCEVDAVKSRETSK